MFYIVTNILSFTILPLLGFLFYILGINFKDGYNKRIIVLFSGFLIVFHGSIQVLFNIIYKYGGIEALINKNTYGSFIGSLLTLKISFIYLGILNIMLLILLDVLVFKYIQVCGKSFWNSTFLVCINSGLICSFFDKIFFRGSYDFILIFNGFLIDIKDIYLFLACILFLCEVILNENTNIIITKQ